MGPYLLFKIYVIQFIGISLRKKMLRPSPDSFHTAFAQWQKGPWVTPKLAVTDKLHLEVRIDLLWHWPFLSISNGNSSKHQV